MNRKFYRFGYSNPPRDAQPRLHHSRDGAAFNEITDPLYSRGFQYGTFIHNYPHHRQPADAFTFLKARDLVVCTTRPPLDDLRPDPTRKQSDEKDWRRIDRSEDHLEQAIFDDLRPFFQRLSRYTVNLTPEIASHLPPTFERMVRIHFHSKGKGTIASTYVPVGGRDHSHKTSKDDFNSVGFFIHLKQITGYPCGLIASFSMGGYENLLWNRIVRLRFQRWFDHPIFCLALLKLPDEPPQPLTPALADDAPAEVLIEHRLPANRKPAKTAAETDPGCPGPGRARHPAPATCFFSGPHAGPDPRQRNDPLDSLAAFSASAQAARAVIFSGLCPRPARTRRPGPASISASICAAFVLFCGYQPSTICRASRRPALTPKGSPPSTPASPLRRPRPSAAFPTAGKKSDQIHARPKRPTCKAHQLWVSEERDTAPLLFTPGTAANPPRLALHFSRFRLRICATSRGAWPRAAGDRRNISIDAASAIF